MMGKEELKENGEEHQEKKTKQKQKQQAEDEGESKNVEQTKYRIFVSTNRNNVS